MVNIANNIADGHSLLANPHSICAVEWWTRDDIENHLGRKMTDDEWAEVSNQIEALLSPDFGLVSHALEIVGIN
tara:strand:- start:8 stop:229 length:222 start_codon:yes stop_codon:yes gene_type:complete